MEEVDYVDAACAGLWGFGSTILIGGIVDGVTKKITDKFNIRGEVDDYLDAVDDLKKAVGLRDAAENRVNKNLKNIRKRRRIVGIKKEAVRKSLSTYANLTVIKNVFENLIEDPLEDFFDDKINNLREQCPVAA